MVVRREFQGVRCPACKRKGLHRANHPHAFGHKDPNRVECRYCGGRFKRKQEKQR